MEECLKERILERFRAADEGVLEEIYSLYADLRTLGFRWKGVHGCAAKLGLIILNQGREMVRELGEEEE